MSRIHVGMAIFFACIFTSCNSSAPVSTFKGTGSYPNSVYISTTSKPLESAVFGSPDNTVTLKIFSDYQCPACNNFHEAIEEKLWKEYIQTNKITAVFYNYPLTMTTARGTALHENAEGDALASLCALSFGKFYEFRNELYKGEHEKAGAKMSDGERIEMAKKVGITDESFPTCLQSAWYQKTLEAEIAEGNRLNIGGTPSVYLNDVALKFTSVPDFFSMLDAVIQKESTKGKK